MPECPNCEKQYHKRACPTCGWEDPSRQEKAPPEPARCWLDGSLLSEEGRCEASGGFPVPKDGSALRCPLACPVCRGGLDWDGGCFRCHGTMTGRREDWAFPGDRYVHKNGHRVSDGGAGRRACTPAENQAHDAAILRAIIVQGARGGKPVALGKLVTVAKQGEDRMDAQVGGGYVLSRGDRHGAVATNGALDRIAEVTDARHGGAAQSPILEAEDANAEW